MQRRERKQQCSGIVRQYYVFQVLTSLGFVACNGPILMINGLYILKTKNCGLERKVVTLSICVYNMYIHNKMILKTYNQFGNYGRIRIFLELFGIIFPSEFENSKKFITYSDSDPIFFVNFWKSEFQNSELKKLFRNQNSSNWIRLKSDIPFRFPPLCGTQF